MLRVAPAAICLVLCIAVFRTASADAIQPFRWRWAAGLALWWAVPCAAAAAIPFRLPTVLAGGAAYLATAGVALRAIYENDHSTAAIGLAVLPVYLAAGLAVLTSGIEAALALQRSARARRTAGTTPHR